MTKNTKNIPYWDDFVKDDTFDVVVGFDEEKVKKMTFEKKTDISKVIERQFGSVSRNKREILGQKKSIDKITKEMNKYVLRQRKQISHHTKLLNKYLDKMEEDRVRYISMLKLLNPKVTLKSKDIKNIKNWRGKVWWGFGRYKNKGWSEFHIISEKKREKLGLSIEEVRELGKDKFRDKLILKDLDFNQT